MWTNKINRYCSSIFLTSTQKSMANCQRWFSEKVIPTLAFSQVKDELKSKNTILIDVREKDELIKDGKISGSKNIPLGEIPTAFQLNDEKFKSLYGFDKPSSKDNIIVHCKLGVRAMKGAQAIQKSGCESVRVYSGIKDWTENGGPVQK